MGRKIREGRYDDPMVLGHAVDYMLDATISDLQKAEEEIERLYRILEENGIEYETAEMAAMREAGFNSPVIPDSSPTPDTTPSGCGLEDYTVSGGGLNDNKK